MKRTLLLTTLFTLAGIGASAPAEAAPTGACAKVEKLLSRPIRFHKGSRRHGKHRGFGSALSKVARRTVAQQRQTLYARLGELAERACGFVERVMWPRIPENARKRHEGLELLKGAAKARSAGRVEPFFSAQTRRWLRKRVIPAGAKVATSCDRRTGTCRSFIIECKANAPCKRTPL